MISKKQNWFINTTNFYIIYDNSKALFEFQSNPPSKMATVNPIIAHSQFGVSYTGPPAHRQTKLHSLEPKYHPFYHNICMLYWKGTNSHFRNLSVLIYFRTIWGTKETKIWLIIFVLVRGPSHFGKMEKKVTFYDNIGNIYALLSSRCPFWSK